MTGAADGAGLRDLPPGTWIVSGLMGTSGVVHLMRPETFEALMPPWLGPPTPWILASGVVELACAAGLLTRRGWAPRAAAVTLAVIWMGNIYYAVDVSSQPNTSPVVQAVAWLRVPLQVPLIRWALRSPVGPGGGPRGG